MVKVIGAGLAGCEAAYALAQRGVEVTLYEMKPLRYSPAHTHEGFAELVCSNSLKASRLGSAAGLLKAEMRALGSVTLPCADKSAVPAGGALAVDREQFSQAVTEAVMSHPLITVHREYVEQPKGSGDDRQRAEHTGQGADGNNAQRRIDHSEHQ